MAGNKKPVKKNTKPIVVSIDDKPLIDTSNLDTAVNTNTTTTTTTNNKKDGKKVAPTTTPTTTTTTPTTTQKSTPVVEEKPASPAPITIAAASNVIIAPAVEAQITDDFSVVPEKNKNKKKINSTATDGTTTTTATNTTTPNKPAPVVRAVNNKKGNSGPRSQFHLLALDEDDVTFDETHSHKDTPAPQQQHSNKKSSKQQQATQTVTQTKKPKSPKESKPVVEQSKPTTTTTTRSTTKPVVEQPKPTATKPVEQPKPTAVATKKSVEQPKQKKSEPQQQKKSEGVLFELFESLITPGIPTVVYKIIFMSLIGVLLFALVPLYYSSLNTLYSVGIVGIVLGLAISLALFMSEIPKVQAEKEQKGKGRKPTGRKLK